METGFNRVDLVQLNELTRSLHLAVISFDTSSNSLTLFETSANLNVERNEMSTLQKHEFKAYVGKRWIRAQSQLTDEPARPGDGCTHAGKSPNLTKVSPLLKPVQVRKKLKRRSVFFLPK